MSTLKITSASEAPTLAALYHHLSGAQTYGAGALACVRDGNAEGAWGYAVSAAHAAGLWYAEIEKLCDDPSFTDDDGVQVITCFSGTPTVTVRR